MTETQKVKKVKVKKTKEELKEQRKEYSRSYYSDPDKRALQWEKMKLYRENNRELIRAKKRARDALKREQKKLGLIQV